MVSRRGHGDREISDGRILGDDDFVLRIPGESEERQKHHFSAHDRRRKIQELIVKTCEEEQIDPKERQSGSRRRPVSRVRSALARQLVCDHGVPPALAARALAVSTSVVSKFIRSTE
ncbi:MAG: hypothetical protein RBS57_08905 [Desulforhabdus sp.]|nr:hypothetical protein [Desulforhabdus sp.]